MAEQIDPMLLLDPEVVAQPHAFYAQLRERAPVWPVGDSGLFLVSTFELVAKATGRVEDLSSSITHLVHRDETGLPVRLPFGGPHSSVLATADPPMHALHRGTVFPELVAKRMEALEGDISGITEELVDAALAQGRVEFMQAIGNLVPITIMSRLIGFHGADIDQLLEAAFDSTAMLGSTLGLDELTQLMVRSAEIGEWITDQVRTAAKDPGEDLLGAVARGIDDGVFGEFEATVILHTLLSAGGESTTSLLGNSVRMLAEDQDLQQRLREQPQLIPAFVEEALRLEPPFRFHMRSVPADTSIGGVAIPAGSTVMLLWGAANRDPAEFDRPDEIDLERRLLKRHVAFGRGIHHCVGAPLARVEARTVLHVLLERTSSITLDDERAPRWVHSLMVRRHDELPVVLAAR